ncbi:MAG TPA: type II toxin-antitoxin system Phd/YefM family antitoxin [Acidimicrobiia bacterium]
MTFTAPAVLGTSEARSQLPAILQRCRTQGASAEPVFIGANRKPVAVIVPAELLERLAPYLEDLALADRLRARLADTRPSLSEDEVDRALGLDPAAVAAERAALLDQLADR